MCDCVYVRGMLARYVAPDSGEKELSRDMGEGLQALIDGALVVSVVSAARAISSSS